MTTVWIMQQLWAWYWVISMLVGTVVVIRERKQLMPHIKRALNIGTDE